MRNRQTEKKAFGHWMGGMVVALLMGMAATSLFSACGDDADERAGNETGEPVVVPDASLAPSRTVLVYVVAENSLYASVVPDVNEMLAGVRQSRLYDGDRILLYVDDRSLPALYLIDNQTTAEKMADLVPVLQYGQDVNSASAEVLGGVIDYMKANYAADSYGLVLWSHGSGWMPSDYTVSASAAGRRRSFGVDNGRNSNSDQGNQMGMDELRTVLGEDGGFDFIFFDACFMQCVEVAYELRRATRYVLGSPAEIPGPGAYYTTMVPAMFKAEGYAEAMLAAYYDYYTQVNKSYGILVSLVDTDGLQNLAASVRTLLGNHAAGVLATDYDEVRNNYFRYGPTASGKWGLSHPDFIDMLTVARPVLDDEAYAAFAQTLAQTVTCRHAESWYSAFNSRLNLIDDTLCSGLSMFVPADKYDWSARRFNETFLDTQWAKDVWAEILTPADDDNDDGE